MLINLVTIMLARQCATCFINIIPFNPLKSPRDKYCYPTFSGQEAELLGEYHSMNILMEDAHGPPSQLFHLLLDDIWPVLKLSVTQTFYLLMNHDVNTYLTPVW